jgi:hypothetical protein
MGFVSYPISPPGVISCVLRTAKTPLIRAHSHEKASPIMHAPSGFIAQNAGNHTQTGTGGCPSITPISLVNLTPSVGEIPEKLLAE